MTAAIVAIYLAGVLIGIVGTDDRWPRRILLSFAWPVGPLTFVLVASGLTLVAAVLWPLVVLPLVAVLGALVWLIA